MTDAAVTNGLARTTTVVPKAAELVAARLRRDIASGTQRPGDMLPPQPELALIHGVSAPTMREALRILETEGLVTVKRGVRGGAYVNEPNISAVARQLGLYLQLQGATVADLYEARIILEPAAARLLAARWNDEAERALRACIDAERTAVEHSPRAVSEAGARFHVTLLELSGNHTLAALTGVLAGIVTAHTEASVTESFQASFVADVERALRWQERLIDLMAAGDGDGAEAHWKRVLQRMSAYVARSGRADTRLDLLG
jgi:DNA-binding FadR family transcriptional regulator